MRRHRETLAHAEMIGGYTTAAVINHSHFRPERWVSPLTYMPSHREHAVTGSPDHLTPEQAVARDLYLGRVYELAAKLREGNHGR